jgi:hypothetical protein
MFDLSLPYLYPYREGHVTIKMEMKCRRRRRMETGMVSPTDLEATIKRLDWNGLLALWKALQQGAVPGWDSGKALEYLVIRAFEIDPLEPALVRYPYRVSLFGEDVEEIDGAVHLPGLSCLVESKDWEVNVAIGPIVKMRSQLLRRPSGTIGLMFTRKTFTQPAIYLAHFTMPQAVLLWSGLDLNFALEAGRISEFLRLKYRVCCEDGIPNYDLRERNIP